MGERDEEAEEGEEKDDDEDEDAATLCLETRQPQWRRHLEPATLCHAAPCLEPKRAPFL